MNNWSYAEGGIIYESKYKGTQMDLDNKEQIVTLELAAGNNYVIIKRKTYKKPRKPKKLTEAQK